MAGEALKKYRESLTDKQKKEMAQKGALTRRKNKFEERQMEKSLRLILTADWNFEDKDGRSRKGSGFEAIATNLMKSALEPQGKNVVSAFKEIRDTIGEKPIDKVEQDNSIEVILPDALKDLFK